jgi:hypothetical protein
MRPVLASHQHLVILQPTLLQLVKTCQSHLTGLQTRNVIFSKSFTGKNRPIADCESNHGRQAAFAPRASPATRKRNAGDRVTLGWHSGDRATRRLWAAGGLFAFPVNVQKESSGLSKSITT